MAMKDLHELIERDDPALPHLRKVLDQAERPCTLLPAGADSASVLLHLQVSTRSTLGAVAFETGGILVDHGWLRILGSGHPSLRRNLAQWNAGRAQGYLLVADDAAGGFFAINGGALGDDIGALYYWAPDSLLWEPLEIGYTDFLGWAVSNRIDTFYKGLRWASWQADMAELNGDQCMSFYPFLWTGEGSVEASARKVVAVAEHYALSETLARQLDNASAPSGH